MKAERLKEIRDTLSGFPFPETTRISEVDGLKAHRSKLADDVSKLARAGWLLWNENEKLRAEIERLSSQAPLQVSGDAALRIRAEAIVASPYWGGCEKNIAEHILTGKYDSLHASVHKAALATPRGEGSQTK